MRSRRRPIARTSDPGSDSERALYGDLLEDVRLLRRRGFGVHRERGLEKAGHRRFRVGNRLVTAAGLRSIAARERRLLVKP